MLRLQKQIIDYIWRKDLFLELEKKSNLYILVKIFFSYFGVAINFKGVFQILVSTVRIEQLSHYFNFNILHEVCIKFVLIRQAKVCY